MIAKRPFVRLDPERMLPWMCVVAGAGWLGAIALRLPAGDGDLLWQRWLGERILREHALPRALGAETFAASGAPWTPQEWLFSTAIAATADHGNAWIVALVCALAAVAALAFVVLRCRKRGVSSVLSSGAVLVCVLAMIQSFGVRAQVLGWAGLACVLWLFELEGPWVWAAVPVTVVWANLHASVFVAPAAAVLVAVAAALRERRWSPEVRRRAALAAACGAATLATPLGWDLPRYAFALMTSPIRHSISEWGATSMASFAFIVAGLPVLLVLAAFGVRTSLRDRIVATAFVVLLFTAVRNVPVFVLATAPIAFAALPRERALRALSARSAMRLAWTAFGTMIVCAGALTAFAWRAAPALETALPFGPARTLLDQARTPPRVFCEDFAWCSLFLADAVPAQVFLDGRCDPYPPAVWDDYRQVLDGSRRWAAILDRRRVDAVLVRRDGALDSLLAERSGIWRSIAADAHVRLYVRPALIARERAVPRGA
jgi:hypothetical protein